MIDRDLVPRGINDPRVLAAFERVPRHLFIDSRFSYQAYADHPLPIGDGQTISQPYIVALMTQALKLPPNAKALDVGTGSGYQAAILSKLCRFVYSVERIPVLASAAKRRMDELDYHNVSVKLGDGWEGWKEYAPYDGIVVAAWAEQLPLKLFEQLKDGGRLVIPIGTETSQELMVFSREANKPPQRKSLGLCSFVPFVKSAVTSLLLMLMLQACAGRNGYYHRVRKGETLYRISKAYEVPLDQVARANNLRDYGMLRDGQYILIPDASGPANVPPAPTGVSQQQQPRRSGERTQSREARRRIDVPKRLMAVNLSGRFAWPLNEPRYRSISREFGEFNKQRHSGIDLQAPLGTQVVAVADGTVIYAGKKVEGFGKTVIIRHAEELFSVYSHLGDINVTANARVKQGDAIGTVGLPDERHFSQTTALLHFEIRERTLAVNPENLLP